MMLRKRVRVADVAPFLFLGCTPFLLFILLVTPLDITYAQDDSGEIFWGEEEGDDEEFFEDDEEFWKMMRNSMTIPMLFLMKKRGKTNFTKMKANSKKKNSMKENSPALSYPMPP